MWKPLQSEGAAATNFVVEVQGGWMTGRSREAADRTFPELPVIEETDIGYTSVNDWEEKISINLIKKQCTVLQETIEHLIDPVFEVF